MQYFFRVEENKPTNKTNETLRKNTESPWPKPQILKTSENTLGRITTFFHKLERCPVYKYIHVVQFSRLPGARSGYAFKSNSYNAAPPKSPPPSHPLKPSPNQHAGRAASFATKPPRTYTAGARASFRKLSPGRAFHPRFSLSLCRRVSREKSQMQSVSLSTLARLMHTLPCAPKESGATRREPPAVCARVYMKEGIVD